MMHAMLAELQDFGLSEKEAKIYLASLEIGRATADQLAKQAKIVRPTAYVQIKSLMERGLMSTYEEGKKTYFAPESPEALRRVIGEQKEAIRTREEELARALPELGKLFASAGERPVVRFFEGKEGINAMRHEALNTKKKEHVVIYSYEGLAALLSREERRAYSNERVSRNISMRSIVSTNEPDIRTVKPLTEMKTISAKDLPLNTDMVAYDDKLNIVLYSDRPFGVLIESEGVADAFRSIFNLLWSKI